MLSYAVGEYPASFLTRGFRIQVAPSYSSAELLAQTANTGVIFSWANVSSYLILGIAGGVVTVRMITGSVTRIISNTITFSRDQLLTITAEPSAGRLTVAGATTGDGTVTGTACTIDSGIMNVADTNAPGAFSLFGRLGRYVVAL